MTEQSLNEQAAHAEQFAQVSRNLQRLAAALVTQHPQFPPADFARCFLAVAIWLMAGIVGDAATGTYLRDLADELEAGKPSVN